MLHKVFILFLAKAQLHVGSFKSEALKDVFDSPLGHFVLTFNKP